MTILAIDFEASCLPRHGRSFPIEVGLAGGGTSRSWLIRPHDAWAGWGWTQEAEHLHGLTRAQIERDGLPADIVLAQLTQTIGGRRVVADSLIDQYWLDTLADAAGCATPFALEHVATLLDENDVNEARIAAAVAMADAQCTVRHRARTDALWLATVLEHLLPMESAPDRPALVSLS